MTAPVAAALFGGAAAGAILNQLFGLFTGWIDRRHGQRQWLLEKRLEAYTAYNGAYRKWDERHEVASAGPLLAELHVAVDGMALLASNPTLRQAQELVWLARATPEDPERETDSARLRRADANRELIFRQRGDLSDRRERRAWAALTRRTVLGEPNH